MSKIFEFNGKRNGSLIDNATGDVGIYYGDAFVRNDKGIGFRGNGVSSRVVFNNTDIIGTENFSLVVWMKQNKNDAYSYPVTNGGGGGAVGFGILCQNSQYGYVRFIMLPSGGTVKTININSTGSQDLKWYCYIVTVDRSGYMKSYINGAYNLKIDISSNEGISLDSSPITIGSANLGGSGWILGDIPYVAIHDKVLTQKDIASIQKQFLQATPTSKVIS